MRPVKHSFLLIIFLLAVVFSFAQKAVETSAAVEYKNNFIPVFQQQDMVKAKSSLSKAKEFIDQAATHPDTKESPKTLYLKGEIYYYIMLLKSIDNTAFVDMIAEQTMEAAIAAWSKAYTISDKFDADINTSIAEKRAVIDMAAVTAYNNKQYKIAMSAYDTRIRLAAVVNSVDTMAIYFAGICAERDSDWGKAENYYIKAAGYGYQIPEIYKLIASVYMQAKKNKEAVTYLKKAIQYFPDDKTLHYALGSFYMEAGQNENALQHLSKAIALDATYLDAQYQLGALLQSQGAALRQKANALPVNDPAFNKMIAESNSFFKQAVIPLEVYLAGNPNDKDVLSVLAQVYKVLQMPEKAAEYKKRLEQ